MIGRPDLASINNNQTENAFTDDTFSNDNPNDKSGQKMPNTSVMDPSLTSDRINQ